MRREFVQLAHKYEPLKYGVAGWFMSEKLDGMRCLWDGGITRGLPKPNVPWANNDNDGRYQVAPICTGLWSRYGNVIHAPDDWLNQLPATVLDGELYAGRNNRQFLMSTVKQLEPDTRWDKVSYNIFDIVPLEMWLIDGLIKGPNFTKQMEGCYIWAMAQQSISTIKAETTYQTVVALMGQYGGNDVLHWHPQKRLPMQTDLAIEMIDKQLETISAVGGEGLIVRADAAIWQPKRSHYIQKVKELDDAEGTVIGYVTGRRTDKGSKLLGLMGALVLVLDNGKIMELSGFTAEERLLTTTDAKFTKAREWAEQNPETRCPDNIVALSFPMGTRVSYKYRGLSNDCIPQEARYWRKKDN